MKKGPEQSSEALARRHKRILIIAMAALIILPLALAILRLLGYL